MSTTTPMLINAQIVSPPPSSSSSSSTSITTRSRFTITHHSTLLSIQRCLAKRKTNVLHGPCLIQLSSHVSVLGVAWPNIPSLSIYNPTYHNDSSSHHGDNDNDNDNNDNDGATVNHHVIEIDPVVFIVHHDEDGQWNNMKQRLLAQTTLLNNDNNNDNNKKKKKKTIIPLTFSSRSNLSSILAHHGSHHQQQQKQQEASTTDNNHNHNSNNHNNNNNGDMNRTIQFIQPDSNRIPNASHLTLSILSLPPALMMMMMTSIMDNNNNNNNSNTSTTIINDHLHVRHHEWIEWLKLNMHDLIILMDNNNGNSSTSRNDGDNDGNHSYYDCVIRLNDSCIFKVESVATHATATTTTTTTAKTINNNNNKDKRDKRNKSTRSSVSSSFSLYRITRDTMIQFVLRSDEKEEYDNDGATTVVQQNEHSIKGDAGKKQKTTTTTTGHSSSESSSLLVTSASKELFSLLRAVVESITDHTFRYSILLHGPTATGKTFAVRSCAQLLHIPLVYVNQITNSLEQSIVTNVQQVLAQKKRDTVILFIDDLQQQKNDTLIVSHWEKLFSAFNALKCKVIVIGSASTDTKNESGRSMVQVSALLRGKFQREIAFSFPLVDERREFCRAQLGQLFMDLNQKRSHEHSAQENDGDSDESNRLLDMELLFSKLGEWTIGYNMGSLNQLAQKIRDIIPQMFNDESNTKTSIMNMIHSLAQKGSSTLSSKWVQASASQAQIGDRIEEEKNAWNEIGGLYEIKEKLQQSAQWPMMYPAAFQRLGLEPPRGILLYGPPGCAKTTLVRVLAKATHSTFIYCNVAQIYSPYVGEAEASVRRVFTEARIMSPSIIFLDEIDALVGKRFDNGTPNASSSGVEGRILSTLLNEMDGVEQAKQVLVIAATNRPDMIDNALMRPGRLDHILYVPPPDEDSRRSILEIHTKRLPLINREEIIDKLVEDTSITGDMTGAEVEALCREACMVSMRQYFAQNENGNGNMDNFVITFDHFVEARNRVTPVLRKHPEMLDSFARFEADFYHRK